MVIMFWTNDLYYSETHVWKIASMFPYLLNVNTQHLDIWNFIFSFMHVFTTFLYFF
jgi:hypothetical protein